MDHSVSRQLQSIFVFLFSNHKTEKRCQSNLFRVILRVFAVNTMREECISKIVNILSVCHSSECEYFSAYSGLNIFPCFRAGDNQSVKSQGSSSGGGQYQMMTNGHSGGVSPNSSQLSTDGRDQGQTLVTRTQKQHVMTNVS